VQRIARLDLIERRGAYWCDAECDGGAATFDGDLWIVTRGREVLAVDTTAARWRAVWGIETDVPVARHSARRTLRGIGAVSDLETTGRFRRVGRSPGGEPATVRCTLRREGAWFAIEASSDGAHEHWYYEGFTLRSRRDCELDGELLDATFVAAWIAQQELIIVTDNEVRGLGGTIALGDAPAIALEIEADLAVIAQRREDGVTVTVGDLASYQAIAILDLAAASTVSVRLVAGVLTLGDDRGRVIVIDPRAGTVLRDLRVSP